MPLIGILAVWVAAMTFLPSGKGSPKSPPQPPPGAVQTTYIRIRAVPEGEMIREERDTFVVYEPANGDSIRELQWKAEQKRRAAADSAAKLQPKAVFIPMAHSGCSSEKKH